MWFKDEIQRNIQSRISNITKAIINQDLEKAQLGETKVGKMASHVFTLNYLQENTTGEGLNKKRQIVRMMILLKLMIIKQKKRKTIINLK